MSAGGWVWQVNKQVLWGGGRRVDSQEFSLKGMDYSVPGKFRQKLPALTQRLFFIDCNSCNFSFLKA